MVLSYCAELLAMCLAILQCGVAGYCSLDKPGYTARVKYIREGFEKRVSRRVIQPWLLIPSTLVICRGGQW